MRKWFRRYHAAIEHNWSLEAAKVVVPMFVIAYIVLYIAHR